MISKSGITFAVAAISVLTLAGCQGSSTAGSQATTAGSSPTPGSSGPAAAGGTSPGAGTGIECAASQLAVAYSDNAQIKNGALAGMSHADSVVMFTNKGSAPCQIQGYPGIAALNAAGAQVMQAQRVGGNIPLITLAPGKTASALVGANTASCASPARVSGLLVTAPDQRTSTRLGPAGQLCLNSLTVAPVEAGNAAGLKL